MPAWPSAHAPEGVLLGLVGAAAFLASAHTPEGVLLRASALLASAHAPEGVLLRASAHTSECVLLGPVGTAALSRVSPRARGRVCSGLRHTRPSACCSALSVLRLFFTSAHAPEGVLLRASACTAECLLLGRVGAAALSRVSPRAQVRVARACRRCGSFPHRPTRPRAGCSGLRRTRPGACCSALSALRLLPASAHAPERVLLRASAHEPECLLLGPVGADALSCCLGLSSLRREALPRVRQTTGTWRSGLLALRRLLGSVLPPRLRTGVEGAPSACFRVVVTWRLGASRAPSSRGGKGKRAGPRPPTRMHVCGHEMRAAALRSVGNYRLWPLRLFGAPPPPQAHERSVLDSDGETCKHRFPA